MDIESTKQCPKRFMKHFKVKSEGVKQKKLETVTRARRHSSPLVVKSRQHHFKLKTPKKKQDTPRERSKSVDLSKYPLNYSFLSYKHNLDPPNRENIASRGLYDLYQAQPYAFQQGRLADLVEAGN